MNNYGMTPQEYIQYLRQQAHAANHIADALERGEEPQTWCSDLRTMSEWEADMANIFGQVELNAEIETEIERRAIA